MPRSPLHRLSLLTLLALVVLTGACRDENERSVYRPGGPYLERLDASGRRMTIDRPDGTPMLKVRASGERYKVYDAKMRRVGELRWDDEADLVEILERPGEPWQAVTTKEDGAVAELQGRFRLERVGDGWALFDSKASLLGYVAREEEGGDWSLRDDFSSAPRLVARGEALEDAAGKARLRTKAAELQGPYLIAMGFDELDALSTVALGAWLAYGSEPASPPAAPIQIQGPPALDAGVAADTDGDAGGEVE